jgi:hypothetical protein
MPSITPQYVNVVAMPGHSVQIHFTVVDALASVRLKATIANGNGRIRLDDFHAWKAVHHDHSYLPDPWGDERPTGVGNDESDGNDWESYDEVVTIGSAGDGEWLAVGDGVEHVTGDLVFQAPTGEAHASHSAKLVVEGWGDRRVEVPIRFVVGGVTVEFPGGPPLVVIGESVLLPVRVTVTPSDIFDLELKFAADGQHVVIPAASVRLSGGTVEKNLTLHARDWMSPGRYTEELWVTGNNSSGPFEGISRVFPFEVVLEQPTPPEWATPSHTQPIKADWWQWRDENPRLEQLKEDYFVSGTFTNKGTSDIQDLAITIFEVTVDDFGMIRGESNLGSTEHGIVAPSHSAPGATPPNKKDWQWFLSVVWVVKGPIYMDYLYRAVISAKDVHGNPYPSVTSAELRVTVGVPNHKWLAGKFAQATAILAAVMLASIILAAAGAVAYAAACAAGAVALDPPEPDPNFRDRIPLPPLGDVPASAPGRNVILLFRLSERIMRIELTKSLIEGRRLGALAAGDTQWVETHAQDLAAATALQRSLANEVRALEPQAKQDIQALVPPGTDLRSAREQMRTTGLAIDLADQIQLPAEQREGIDSLLRSNVALPDADIVETIDATFAPLTEFADSLD